jgi:hypothetical protein
MTKHAGTSPRTRPDDGFDNDQLVVGWTEWVSLPEIGVKRILAKMDTGARTSALHAPRIVVFQENGAPWVNFALDDDLPMAGDRLPHTARLTDLRDVKSSSGHVEQRYLIETEITLASLSWRIEITLTDRSDMKVPFLIGRSAMVDRLVIDPSMTFLTGGKRPRVVDEEE